MEFDVDDVDMSSLFTFDVDDFTPPPPISSPSPPSPPSPPDRLPLIDEETSIDYLPNIHHNHQQQQLDQQPQQNKQQLNYILVHHLDGQISVKFLPQPQSQLSSDPNLNSQNYSQLHSKHSKPDLHVQSQTDSNTQLMVNTESNQQSQNNILKSNGNYFKLAKLGNLLQQMDMIYPVTSCLMAIVDHLYVWRFFFIYYWTEFIQRKMDWITNIYMVFNKYRNKF